MGSFRIQNFGFRLDPPPPQSTNVSIQISPLPLIFEGVNLPVFISTASAYRLPNDPGSVRAIQILAHFDTGATKTSIDTALAKQLNLIPVGESPSYTAAGLRQATDFVIDLSFPATNLQPFRNLPISSCDLTGPHFKMLLGRDIMARWSIVWDGPSSTIIISD